MVDEGQDAAARTPPIPCGPAGHGLRRRRVDWSGCTLSLSLPEGMDPQLSVELWGPGQANASGVVALELIGATVAYPRELVPGAEI